MYTEPGDDWLPAMVRQSAPWRKFVMVMRQMCLIDVRRGREAGATLMPQSTSIKPHPRPPFVSS